eukprot:gene11578-11722_t
MCECVEQIQVRNRDEAIKEIERILQKLSDDPSSGVAFVKGSRWMSIFREVSFMLTSRHGHPLHRNISDKHEKPFPWKGVGYLRLRSYKVLVPTGAFIPTAMPGQADLTFKMKKIDPDVGAGQLQMSPEVGDAKLTAKMENDMHCDHQRVTMSPLYKPVAQSLNISSIGNVQEYFPNLAKMTRLDADELLPFMHDVYRAKIMWTVVFEGVIGEANLVIKYNTSFDDAVSGRDPKNGEVSLRIRREVAEATGTTGEEGKRALYAAMDSLASAMQHFRDAGWDGKTPAASRAASMAPRLSTLCVLSKATTGVNVPAIAFVTRLGIVIVRILASSSRAAAATATANYAAAASLPGAK